MVTKTVVEDVEAVAVSVLIASPTAMHHAALPTWAGSSSPSAVPIRSA